MSLIYKKLNKKILHGFKNATYLTIANFLSTVISLVGFIYIPNKLGVTNYGYYVTAGSFVSLFSILTFEGLTKVVLREASRDIKQVSRFIHNLFLLKLLLSIFQVISIFIVALFIQKYDWYLKILIFIASTEAVYRALNTIPQAIIQAKEEMKYLSVLSVVQSLIRVSGIMLLLHFFNNLFVVMVYIATVNLIFVFIYYNKLQKIISFDFPFFKISGKIKIPKRLIQEAFVFTLIGIGGKLSLSIDVAMLSWIATPEEVGIYGIAEKLVNKLVMFRGIILTAFFPIFIKRFHQGAVKISKLYKTSAAIMGLTLILALMISFFSSDLIGLLYKNEYHRAAPIISVLVFYLVFFFSNLPFSTAIQSVGLEKILLYLYPATIILNIVLNYTLYQSFGIIGFACSTLTVQLIIYFYFVFVGTVQLKKQGYVK